MAAYAFLVLPGSAISFQLALAAGEPWGRHARGGMFPGELPVHMRIASVVSALLLLGFGIVVCARAGIGFVHWHALSRTLVWVVVAWRRAS